MFHFSIFLSTTTQAHDFTDLDAHSLTLAFTRLPHACIMSQLFRTTGPSPTVTDGTDLWSGILVPVPPCLFLTTFHRILSLIEPSLGKVFEGGSLSML